MAEDSRVALVEGNQLAWVRALASLPGHRLIERPFALWTIPARPAGVLAVVRVRFDEAAYDEQLGEILRSYQDADCPANWSLAPAATPADVVKRLRKRHFMGPIYLAGMVRELAPPLPAAAPGAAHVVEDWNALPRHPWATIMPKAGRADTVAVLRELEALAPRRAYSLIGLVDGAPAASAVLFVDGETAGLWQVATIPALRRRGAARAACLAALHLARELGCRQAVLLGSPKGTPLYASLGFTAVGRFASMYYSRVRMRADREARGEPGRPAGR